MAIYYLALVLAQGHTLVTLMSLSLIEPNCFA